MPKKILITYRENDNHETYIPYVTQIIQYNEPNAIVNILSYPSGTDENSIQKEVSNMLVDMDTWTYHISDITSSIPFTLRNLTRRKEIKQLTFESIYKALHGFKRELNWLSSFDEARELQWDELDKLIYNDISIIVQAAAHKINRLKAIERVIIVSSRIIDHISSPNTKIHREMEEKGIDHNDDTHKKMKPIFDLSIANIYKKELEKACIIKDIVVVEEIDDSRDFLSKERTHFLENFDKPNTCIIIDWHTKLWNRNRNSKFRFDNALVLAPENTSLTNNMETENKNRRKEKLSTFDRYDSRYIKRIISEELLTFLKNK